MTEDGGRASGNHDSPTRADVVIPTIGRDSLALLLASLDGPPDRLPHRVIVVDDRPDPAMPLPCADLSPELTERLDVFASGGHGRAAARNRGWHASRAEWIAFLDDDVIPCRGWLTELGADLDALPVDVAVSRGRVRVPIEEGHAPSPHASAPRADANVAYRRSALLRVGGFDEGVPRTAREEPELARRVCEAGLRVVDGRRTVMQPAWSADPNASAHSRTGASADGIKRIEHGSQQWGAARTATTAARRLAPFAGHFIRQRLAAGARSVRALMAMPFAAIAQRVAPDVRASHHTGPPRIARRPVDAVLFERAAPLAHDSPSPAGPAPAPTNPRVRTSGVPKNVPRREDVAVVSDVIVPLTDVVDCRLGPED